MPAVLGDEQIAVDIGAHAVEVNVARAVELLEIDQQSFVLDVARALVDVEFPDEVQLGLPELVEGLGQVQRLLVGRHLDAVREPEESQQLGLHGAQIFFPRRVGERGSGLAHPQISVPDDGVHMSVRPAAHVDSPALHSHGDVVRLDHARVLTERAASRSTISFGPEELNDSVSLHVRRQSTEVEIL
ncbi:hypothetical protein Mapa_015832 [Marchantia paleacea]|nr:hypothetical protein Mapa_015832 [Marchantia paleacea]